MVNVAISHMSSQERVILGARTRRRGMCHHRRPSPVLRSVAFHTPSVMAYLADSGRYEMVAKEALQSLQAGPRTRLGPQFPLSDAGSAQSSLETGGTIGTPLLVI